MISRAGLGQTSEQEPEFLQPLDNLTVTQGRDVSFTCVVNNLGQYRVSLSSFYVLLMLKVLSDTRHVLRPHPGSNCIISARRCCDGCWYRDFSNFDIFSREFYESRGGVFSEERFKDATSFNHLERVLALRGSGTWNIWNDFQKRIYFFINF